MKLRFIQAILALCFSIHCSAVSAISLFGIDLAEATTDNLRDAAKLAGVVLIREGGQGNWFDSYDSSAVFPGSTFLYLGFLKQDKRLAFAEYEFTGRPQPGTLKLLNLKYGQPQVKSGKFLSDREYQWEIDTVEIKYYFDWHRYKTRLTYINPGAIEKVQKEQRKFIGGNPNGKGQPLNNYY
ncbi:MAG: hypothetical protein ACI8XC_001917 [Gammaproteobacteria bacterium]|jgi:hypothetical protein